MILELIKAISTTDGMTEALSAIVDSNHPLTERLKLSKSIWQKEIQEYIARKGLSQSEQAACVNTFLFFSVNPLIDMTRADVRSILTQVFTVFERPSSPIRSFNDENFHDLPLNCTTALGMDFLRAHEVSSSVPEVLDDVLCFYRFIELFARTAIQPLYLQYVAKHRLEDRQYQELRDLTLQHGADHLMLMATSERQVTALKPSHVDLIIQLQRHYRCSIEPVRANCLGLLLPIKQCVFDGDFRGNPELRRSVNLVFSQASLLLTGLQYTSEPELLDRLSRLVLKLNAEDIPSLSPLARGNPRALVSKVFSLMPALQPASRAELPAELAGLDDMADFKDPQAVVSASEDPQASEAPQAVVSASEDPRFSEDRRARFFAKFQKDFENGLKGVSLDQVIANSEDQVLGFPSRDIGNMGQYVFFLLSYFLEKRPESFEAIKGLEKEAKKTILGELAVLAREKNRTYQRLAFNMIHARFERPTGLFANAARKDTEQDHEYAFSISRDETSRTGRQQAKATVNVAGEALEAVTSREFQTKSGKTFQTVQYQPEKITSCLSRWSMSMEGARFHIVSVSGRQAGPLSGGIVENILDSDGRLFDRNAFYQSMVNGRTLFADYPMGMKPVLFLLMEGFLQLSKQPCEQEPHLMTLHDVLLPLRVDVRDLGLDSRLFALYIEVPVQTLVTNAFRGKTAVLIAGDGQRADLQTQLIVLCNTINGIQDRVICAVMDTLPRNDSELLSALLRIQTNAEHPIKNALMNRVPTRSLCAELSIVPAMALVISLLGVSPLGLFNSPISTTTSKEVDSQKRDEKLAELMARVDGKLWHPCGEYCDPRRLTDKLFLESSRNERAFFDMVEALFDGQFPQVIRSLADLKNDRGDNIGLGILYQNQAFVAWTKTHSDPAVQSLFTSADGASFCAFDKATLVRTVSTGSSVSDVSVGMDYWLDRIMEILRAEKLTGAVQLLALNHSSPLSSPCRFRSLELDCVDASTDRGSRGSPRTTRHRMAATVIPAPTLVDLPVVSIPPVQNAFEQFQSTGSKKDVKVTGLDVCDGAQVASSKLHTHSA